MCQLSVITHAALTLEGYDTDAYIFHALRERIATVRDNHSRTAFHVSLRGTSFHFTRIKMFAADNKLTDQQRSRLYDGLLNLHSKFWPKTKNNRYTDLLMQQVTLLLYCSHFGRGRLRVSGRAGQGY